MIKTIRKNQQARTLSARALPIIRLLPLVAAAIEFGHGAAHAATIVVDDTTAGSVPGKCTIIDAVTALNTQSAVNGCAAGDSSNDTIDLHGFAASATISLTQSATGHALLLTRPAAFRGSLAADGTPFVTLERSSVSGTPAFGLLMSTAALTIDGLILQNGLTPSGYCGAAISVGDTLLVTNSVIRNNVSSGGGGGIFATGNSTLRNSIVSGNSAAIAGGGIAAIYSLRLYDSTLSNNTVTAADAMGGGAIYGAGLVIASHSTISGNTSSGGGGGIYSMRVLNLIHSTVSNNAAQNGPGGGVYALNAGISVQASTISNNTATKTGGGVSASEADFTNSTISGNHSGGDGAGLFATNATAVYTTLSGNASTSGKGGGINFASSAVANGTIVYGNLPDDVNTPLRTGLTGSFDLIGNAPWGVPADTLACNPGLSALGNYGGATATMQLGSGSCAIDAASTTPSVNTDQRDDVRPGAQGSRADIGASEANAQQQSSNDPIFGCTFE